ncbi:MAG: hypothetical protein B5766_11685 [Candidatus Lumbricidophila eiseniae]|uniref:Uncharacterized protein n=1 Tax=Candidatus Lumbricidiphila eiseniae TaxID=1969409 RepID=A0A2A6FN36_9MICO|nr:MAG: hypothetical protein B5766_11685 [Candidatus Lumbricidophila eiseniae]
MGVAGLVGVEDDIERFGEDGSDGAVFVDVDLDEEGLVAEPAGLVVTSGVDAGYVGGEVEAVADVGAGFGVVIVVLGEARVDGVEFGAELALPGLELVEGDRVSEVGVEGAFLVGEVLCQRRVSSRPFLPFES